MNMEKKIKMVSSCFEKKHTELQEKQISLKADSREDEAVLCKVGMNICEIYKNMLKVARKKADGQMRLSEEEKEQLFCREYLNLMHKITLPWSESLEAARKADDYRGVLVEEVKLDMAKQLEEIFKREFGEPI